MMIYLSHVHRRGESWPVCKSFVFFLFAKFIKDGPRPDTKTIHAISLKQDFYFFVPLSVIVNILFTPDMIKHIFLDLGMVTVRLDMQRCIDAFKKLGIGDVDQQISNCRQSGIFNGIELGLVSVQDFHDHVRQHYRLNLSDEQIDEAWNAFILDTPVALQQLVARLKQRYRTCILSNTNQIHFDFWAIHCMGGEGGLAVEQCFDKCYLSNHLHLAKPDPQIYRAVMADCGAKPDECLYFDDNQANVEAARNFGWHAFVSETPEQTIELLTKFEKDGRL